MEYKVQDNSYGIAELQTELLRILHEYIRICDHFSLRWWTTGGTSIGALRHKGFIPWDDDLDVVMPRPDYEQLWALRDEINRDSRFILTRTDEKKNYHHRVMQLVDVETTFIHIRSEKEDIEHGVYIDIIPLDARAPGKLGYARQIFNAMVFSVYNIQCLPEYRSGRAVACMTSLALGLLKSKKLRYQIWRHCEKEMMKYDWDGAHQVVNLVCDIKSMLRPYESVWFRGTEKCLFEDTEVNLPAGARKILHAYFGDFMQLPREEERHPIHNTRFIDLEHPYTQYKGKYYCVGKVADAE